MITTGTKWFVGLGFVSLVLAAAYGWSTGGDGLGPVSLGYKGAVGDHFGYGLLVTAGLLSLVQGLVLTAVRDADPQAQAQVVGADTVPPVRPAGVSYWPPVAAFGVGLVLIGLVSEPILVVFGLIAIGVVLVEWTVQTWADHATGDPETNRRIRNRLMNPVEYPVAGALAVGLVVISISRVFLAVSSLGAVWVAAVIGGVAVLLGWLVAAQPKASSNVIVGLLLAAAVVVIGLGVAGGVAGEREFHEIGGEHEDEGQEQHEDEAPDEGAAPRLGRATAEGARWTP
jgi:hypothetical protein